MEKVKSNKFLKSKTVEIIFLILIVIFSISGIRKTFQNDTFFDIVVGESILEDGFYNIENTTIHEGLKYNAIHWTFNILVAKLYEFFGYTGIFVMIMLVAVGTSLLMYKMLKNMHISPFVAFACTIFSTWMLSGLYTGRAQIFLMLFLLIAMYSLEKLIETDKKRYMFFTIISYWCIANVQSYIYVISFSMFLPYIVEMFYNRKLNETKSTYKLVFEKYKFKNLIITFVMCMLVGIINPYGISIYIEPFIVIDGYAKKIISELLPTVFLGNLQLVSISIVFFMLLLFSKTKIKFRHLLLFMMYLGATMYALKFVIYFSVVSTFILAEIIQNFIELHDENTTTYLKKNNLSKTWVILVFLFIITWAGNRFVDNLMFKEYDDRYLYPVEAAEWIRENLDYKNIRMYNFCNFGSYLEFKDIPIFIDTRNEMYENKDEEKSIMRDMYRIIAGEANYNDIFEKYNMNYALVCKDEVIYPYINVDEKFNNIYEDEYFVIYEKIEK